MSIIQGLVACGIPIARGVAGWLENALEDGKIEDFEWRQLGATVMRVGTIGVLAYYGLNGIGVNVDVIAASAGSAVVDYILVKIRNGLPN